MSFVTGAFVGSALVRNFARGGGIPPLIQLSNMGVSRRHVTRGSWFRNSSAVMWKSHRCASSSLQDEYGDMTAEGLTYNVPELLLESGKKLKDVEVRYKTFGSLNPARENVMVVCHALTGNAALDSWWGDMLGPGLLFDTDRYFVVCANILGSCYGTTGPTSVDPSTGSRYGVSFPDVTVRDSVGLHIKLVEEELGANQVACVIGGSLGGMQTLEWGLMAKPGFVRSLVPMCCGAYHHPWQIAISETQRQAIYADPSWNGGSYSPDRKPFAGLSVARQIAMVSYRSHQAYSEKFGRKQLEGQEAGNGQERLFDVESYLRYQGEKFCDRFDPLSYVKCTRLMDTHDVGRGRGGMEAALGNLDIPSLVIAVDSDALYPPSEQEELCRYLPQSTLHVVESPNGHDGFLLDQQEIMAVAKPFIDNNFTADSVTARCRNKQQRVDEPVEQQGNPGIVHEKTLQERQRTSRL